MKYLDSIKRAARSLKNAKARTALTSLAIAVGAFTLTLSLAAGEGARQYADKLIKSNIDSQAMMVFKDKAIMENSAAAGLKEYDPNSVSAYGTNYASLDTNDIDKLAKLENVKKVVPFYMMNAQYVQFQGVDKKYTSEVGMYRSGVLATAKAGDFPALGTQIGDDEVVIPESYATSLNMSPESLVGKTVTLHIVRSAVTPSADQIKTAFMQGGEAAVSALYQVESRDAVFKIRAVSTKSSTMISTGSSGVLVSENSAKTLSDYITQGTSNYQKYMYSGLIVSEGKDPAAVKVAIEKQGMYALTANDMQGVLFTIVNTLQGIVLGFGVIALIASVFGIINTQYISVLERTREIGLMKALGMRRRHVSRLFQLEAAWIGFLGGVIGAGLAWAIGAAMNPWITQQLGLGEGNSLLIFQILPVILLIVGLILIAMIAGWFPARKAAKLDPIEALRTE